MNEQPTKSRLGGDHNHNIVKRPVRKSHVVAINNYPMAFQAKQGVERKNMKLRHFARQGFCVVEFVHAALQDVEDMMAYKLMLNSVTSLSNLT